MNEILKTKNSEKPHHYFVQDLQGLDLDPESRSASSGRIRNTGFFPPYFNFILTILVH